MNNDNKPQHDATRRPQSRFSAGSIEREIDEHWPQQLRLPIEMLDDPAPTTDTSALDAQVGGGHYKDMPIQPVEFIHVNGIGYMEGNVIKYVTRWRAKGGIKDLEKAKHYIDLLIELEGK